MDARGYEAVPGVGWVMLINLSDCYSHTYLLSYPCVVGTQRVTRHPDTRDYQDALRLAFMAWGLPASIQADHESVFYDNLDKSPFPTRLHLWLLALGAPLTFGRLGRPTDQGLVERSHQTWYRQVLQGQRFADLQALHQALQERRDFLNYHLPCASLAERPPGGAANPSTLPARNGGGLARDGTGLRFPVAGTLVPSRQQYWRHLPWPTTLYLGPPLGASGSGGLL